MPRAKNLPSTHKQCWQAVNLKDLHPQLSCRQIGSKIGRSQTFVSKCIRLARLHNSVVDQPRPGRPHKLNTEATQHILAAARQKQCKSAAAIAAESSAKGCHESQCQHSATCFQKGVAETPQAQGCTNVGSKSETHKGQDWHRSPEDRHNMLAQHHDH